MKNVIITIIITLIAVSIGHAQYSDGTITQPTHVVARRINSEGEVTKEFISDFHYYDDGKLSRYEIPEYNLTANYTYTDDYLEHERIAHNGGHPTFEENNLYTYENGQIKTISHLVDQMGFNSFWVYSYYPDGRLERKDFREEDENDFHTHWLYDYENEGKTVVESYCTSWPSQGMLLRKKTTKQYDDNFVLSSTYTENYSESGELTSVTRTDYGYSTSGLLETKTTQTLIEDEWYNSSITSYSYDEIGQITEQLDCTWDAENSEWNPTHKIVFETSEPEQTYTVSFYKKSGGEWVWDVFNRHTILFGSNLKAQQSALGYFVYEDMNGYGNINQFVFTMEMMNEPVYLSAEDHQGLSIDIYPNPCSGLVTITGKNMLQAEVINTLGQQVLSVQGKGNELCIDMATMPSGIYFVTINDEEGRKCVRKLVRE